jgi:hypothetical protein
MLLVGVCGLRLVRQDIEVILGTRKHLSDIESVQKASVQPYVLASVVLACQDLVE